MPYKCSNPECDHVEAADPCGPCPACSKVVEGAPYPVGWSMMRFDEV